MKEFIPKMFYKQRSDFEKTYASRRQEYPLDGDVLLQENIFYAEDHLEKHRLDIYRPKNSGQKSLPVIINVHGGGLLMGNKEFNQPFCASLSKQGYLVFSLEYGLIPDCDFFDQLRDLYLAFDSIKDSLSLYGGDASRIYACGDSGGACLLLYGTAIQRNKKLAAAAHLKPSSLQPKALGLISGMFYTARFDKIGLFLPKYLYGKHYKKTAFAPYVNPEHPDIVTVLPPCLLVTSRNDNLRSYTLDFEKALSRQQMPHKLIDFPKDSRLTHAFSVFYPSLKESRDVVKSVVRFFEATEKNTKER